MTTTTYTVSGMTCGHCVTAVTEEVSALPSVSAVAVHLDSGGSSEVVVSSDLALDENQVAAAVEEAGYKLARTSQGQIDE